jgi:hypothetical protein
MNLLLHAGAHEKIAEFTSDGLLITREEDAIALMQELFSTGAQQVILHRENIAPEFFDLRTGLAGAVLQKFVNYHLQVAIVGDFSHITSEALKAFIYESNRGRQIFFVESVESARQKLSAALDEAGL